jgi:DNA-binding NtrC family response regulator
MLEHQRMTRRILIVDDDFAMLQMLEALVHEQGWDTDAAESVDEAISLLRHGEYDAVLSDIHLGASSGLDLVGELHLLWPDTPIVLMTAFGSVDTEIQALRAGAFGYLPKPFEPEAALLALESAYEARTAGP